MKIFYLLAALCATALALSGCADPIVGTAGQAGGTAHQTAIRAVTDTNIAIGATSSTSFVSAWESIAALNDGFTPANSGDRAHAVYGNWDNPGTTQWVQYNFAQNYTLSKAEVYWFDDDQGIDLPASCSYQYWNGSTWVNVQSPSGLGVAANTFNATTFTPVATTRIRLNITARPSFSTGILEWRVWGTAVSASPSPSPSVSPSPSPGGNYTFPGYTNIPATKSNQTYLSNPALAVATSYGGVANVVKNGYIAFSMGASRPAALTDTALNTSLTRINGDLKWLVETQGLKLPGFTNQYYINYFLLGSGLSGDSTPTTNTPESGGSGWTQSGGVWYPDVETTYHTLTNNDDYHRWSISHEFVHVLQNAYGTIDGNEIAWIHEAHNNYVMALVRKALTGQSTLGWLDAYTFLGSYIPIESCGILADGTVTGPGDYIQSNWLGNYGGYRYAVSFPLFVSQRVGPYLFNAIWTQSTNKTSHESILGTMIRLIGKSQVQQALIEYGARNALVDYSDFSADMIAQIKGQWNTTGNWFYTATTTQSGWLTPSDSLRLPRHTGRNNIPITPTAGATSVSVNFSPNAAGSAGSASELRAQLVYRATDGTVVASTPVASGTTTIALTKAMSKGVVVLVVTNIKVDGYNGAAAYGWNKNESFGYKFQITNGSTASTSAQYF